MQQLQSDNGLVAVMALCAGISFTGNLFTLLFVQETGGKTLEEVDDACETLKKYHLNVESTNGLNLRKVVVEANLIGNDATAAEHAAAGVKDVTVEDADAPPPPPAEA